MGVRWLEVVFSVKAAEFQISNWSPRNLLPLKKRLQPKVFRRRLIAALGMGMVDEELPPGPVWSPGLGFEFQILPNLIVVPVSDA